MQLQSGKLYQLTLQGVDSLAYYNPINGRYLGQILNKNIFLFLKATQDHQDGDCPMTVLQCLFGETIGLINIKTSAMAANVKQWAPKDLVNERYASEG